LITAVFVWKVAVALAAISIASFLIHDALKAEVDWNG